MATEDDDKPRKKVTHEIGQDLSLLSVEALTERIALMNSEIERLQVAMSKKLALKVGYQVRHNSDVGPGVESTDQLITTNLVYSFGK